MTKKPTAKPPTANAPIATAAVALAPAASAIVARDLAVSLPASKAATLAQLPFARQFISGIRNHRIRFMDNSLPRIGAGVQWRLTVQTPNSISFLPYPV